MAESEGQTKNDGLAGGHLSAAISNKVVQIMSEHTGRGPTRARTYLNDSMVVCVLQDTLTKGERALAERERVDTVIDLRRNFQEMMRGEMTAAVEDLTGQQVIAFMSDNHVDPDFAVEVFMLQPQSHSPAEVPVVGAEGGTRP